MKSDELPERKELEDLKVKLSSRKTREGYDEAIMKGYPEIFPGEKSHVSHFLWRFERWMIGHMYHGRWRAGNGWKLILVSIVLAITIYGGSKQDNPFFGYFIVTLISFFGFAFIFGYFFYDKEIYIGGIEDVKEGELIPVSWEKDETGKRNFQYIRAPFNQTDVFKIPLRALDFAILWGVREIPASNEKYTLRLKNHYHNLAWGDNLYSDLDTAALNILEPEVTLLPVEIEKAIDRFKRYAKKDNLSGPLAQQLIALIREMYAAGRLIENNRKEIINICGKDFIKIKRSKHTEALFLSWESSVIKLEEEIKQQLAQGKKRKTEFMQLINNARDIKLHEPDIEVYGQTKYQEGLRKGWTNKASTEISTQDIALSLKAQKAVTNAEAKRAIEDEMSAIIREAMGETKEDD